jgi:hypothetical protein
MIVYGRRKKRQLRMGEGSSKITFEAAEREAVVAG